MPTVEIREAVDPQVPRRFEVLENKDKTNAGGEGEVFMSADGRWAVKIYYHPSRTKAEMIRKIMEIFRSLPADQARFIVPPLAQVASIDGQPKVGFVMRQIAKPPHQELMPLIFDPTYAGKYLNKGKKWRSWLHLARNIANCIVVLHGKGCAHSDIHYRNFLVDIDTLATIMMEADGVVIEGFKKAEVKGMKGFMAPEVLIRNEMPNEGTDRHSLAVLVLHTLLFRNVMLPQRDYDDDPDVSDQIGWGQEAVFSEHPTDRRNFLEGTGKPLFEGGWLSYRMLTPRLQRLTETALIAGVHDPEQRPLSRAWLHALSCALDELHTCAFCGQDYPYPYWLRHPEAAACPFCGRSAAQGAGAANAAAAATRAPLVMHLYEESLKGEFRPLEWVLVLRDGESLYRDMTDCLGPAPLESERRVVAPMGHIEFDARQSRYLVCNDSNSVWSAWSLTGGGGRRLSAGRGESIPVGPGICIRFGSSGRLALVTHTARAGMPAAARQQTPSAAGRRPEVSETGSLPHKSALAKSKERDGGTPPGTLPVE